MTAVEVVNSLREYEFGMEWFEFKTSWFQAEELGQYISALSNSAAILGRKKAYMVWGLDDASHEIVGTTFNPNMNVKGEPLQHYLARQLSPEIHFIFEELEMEGKRVVLLSIPAAKTVPVSFSYDRFIRIGSGKENLRKYPERESYLFSVLRNGLPTIENTPSQWKDLTFDKLEFYYMSKGIKLNPETWKRNLGLYTEDGEYNLMAQLLSDNSHINIRVAIFMGRTKADPLRSVSEFGQQCLLYTLDDILRFGDILNIPQADERGRVVERKEIPLFDRDAFREAVINAFVHNRWVGELEPMITVFSNRIEILSRGAISDEQTLEGFFSGVSVPVNKKLSEIFL